MVEGRWSRMDRESLFDSCRSTVPALKCSSLQRKLKCPKDFDRARGERRVPSRFTSCWASAFLMSLFTTALAMSQERSQTRSLVISRNGIVAAESPLAAQAGAQILEKGGNAVDAAITTNAMMGVVSPMMNGIGGDLFAIVYDAKANKLYGLSASGWDPKGFTVEVFNNLVLREMRQAGAHPITVPGAVDGCRKMADKFGR